MRKETLAAKLNGREYGEEITAAEEQEAKAAGLVVVFGYSDDNMELRGAVHDEIECGEHSTFRVTREGVVPKWEAYEEKPKDEAMRYFRLSEMPSVKLEAEWDHEGYSWTYATCIRNAPFDIMEDGEKYCRGIVFDTKDLPQ